MPRRHEIGVCRVWAKGDAGSYTVHPDCHAELEKAWMDGKPFYIGYDLFKARLTLKLGDIAAIGLATAEQCREYDEDDKAERLTGGEG